MSFKASVEDLRAIADFLAGMDALVKDTGVHITHYEHVNITVIKSGTGAGMGADPVTNKHYLEVEDR